MDPPEHVLGLIRNTLGCNGVRNFFDFGLLRQATLEKRIEMASKKLTSLNRLSLCVVWLVERMLRTNKAARPQVVEEWVNYESCLNYRSDSVGSSPTFKEDMRAVEDEIVKRMEMARGGRSRPRGGATTAIGGLPLFSHENRSPKKRDRFGTERQHSQHYSPSRSRRQSVSRDVRRPRRDSRDRYSPRKTVTPSPKTWTSSSGIKQKESLSALKEPRPPLPLGNVDGLTGLLNYDDDKKDDSNLLSANSPYGASGNHDSLRLDYGVRKNAHGDRNGPNAGQLYPAGPTSRRFSTPTAHIENLRLLSANSFEANQKLPIGSQPNERCNHSSYLDPYETQPAELPGISSEQSTPGIQSPLASHDTEPGEVVETPSSCDSGIRRANKFLDELGSAETQKRKYKTYEDDEGISVPIPEFAPKRARMTEQSGSVSSNHTSEPDEDDSVKGTNTGAEPSQALYHPFIAAVKRAYGGIFRKKPERKTALEIWDEAGSGNDEASR